MYSINKAILLFLGVCIVGLFFAACSFDSDNTNGNLVVKKLSIDNTKPKGIGLAGVADWSPQFPFIDLMKQARTWKDWGDKESVLGDINQDAYGWVTSLLPGQTAGTVFLVNSSKEVLFFKRIIVLYKGKGVIRYPWAGHKVLEESYPGIDMVEVGTGNHLLQITETDPLDPIRDIRIIPEPLLEDYNEGKLFNPIWLKRIDHFSALRFMDWMKTNNSKQKVWSDRPLIADRIWSTHGVPLEIMIRLSNELKMDPWFNIPHSSDEEYIISFAKLLKKNLDNRLTAYIEHSNEVWNWQFQQAKYAHKSGQKLWGNLSDAYMQWHGMRTAQICTIFKKNIFPGEASRIKCILGIHTAWRGLHKSALLCPEYKKVVGKSCSEHGLDYLAITTYFSGGLNGPRVVDIQKPSTKNHEELILRWASMDEEGVSLAFSQLFHGNQMRNIGELESFKGIYNQAIEKFGYWSSEADSFGLGLVAYEGGAHITAASHSLQENSLVKDFHIAVNRSPYMEDAYKKVLSAWYEQAGGLHMHFVDFSRPSKWGSWGALEELSQVSSPKWRAITGMKQNGRSR